MVSYKNGGYTRVPKETDPMLEKAEPRDVYNFVYLISLLNGVGVLLPWNMFITIAPQYYVDYWFTQNGTTSEYAGTFMSALGVASQVPNVSVNFLNIFVVIGGSLLFRIVGPLILNCFCVAAVILMVVLFAPNIDDMGWFYIATLGIVILINTANGVYQNSIFGLFADFPANYTNGIVLGNNICGTFTSVLSIVCSLVFTDVRTVATLYFTISFAVLILCLVSIFSVKKSPFFQFYEQKGIAARKAENATKPSFAQYLETIRKGWVQFVNVYVVFLVTLTIFPAMLAATPLVRKENAPWPSIIPENVYVSISTFLNFNVFATIGSFVAGIKQWPGPKQLWIVVWLRVLFVPFFMFCNYIPGGARSLPVIFTNEWMFFFSNSLMAFTSGYFSSLAMMYAPRVVPDGLSKIAGMIAALCLIAGIASGVSFTFVIQYLTTHL